MKENNTHTDSSKGKPNALIHASSPYLLQHAYNPVDWMEWGDMALEKAGRENKLLIISIGYAACHWCHVMEHESFEDQEVAELMNGFFVNIKVDREQRPDIDAVYMNAAQLCSGRGGWPLNVIALPDGKPVWAATYFPKAQWMQILNQFALTWEKTPEELREHADTLTQDLRNVENTRLQTSEKHAEITDTAVIRDRVLQMMDVKRGGLDKSPKFPLPNIYTYLLTDYFFFKEENSLKATNVLLVNMASGGIYDQLGGGFSRYSVDEYWFAPHFEKMLYDNGQLLSLYTQAYQLTGISLYRAVIAQTVDWLKRDMLSPEGGFYTALDADSEGEEGKFYCWEEKEINALVPASIQEAFKEYYTILPEGNWEEKNILYIGKSRKQVCEKYGFSETVFVEQLDQARKILLDYRENHKIKPALDDKILAGWNGLAIAGLVDAFSATGESEYLSLALRAAGFVKQYMQQENGRLYRSYKNGKPEINAFLEDYAFMIMAFIKLYEISGDPVWMKDAETWMEIVEAGFSAENTAFYFYTHHEDPELVARTTEVADNVIPASNSQMALNLFRMGNLLYREDWIEKAKQMLGLAADGIHTHPAYHSNWAILSLLVTQGIDVVAITGENAEAAARKIKNAFRPNILLAFSKTPVDYPPVLEAKGETGKTMVYVCRDKVCDAPMEWNTGTE